MRYVETWVQTIARQRAELKAEGASRSEINMILKVQFQKDFEARAYFTLDEFREWAKDQRRDPESIALFYQFLQAMGYVVRGRGNMIRHCCVSVHPERASLDCDSVGNCPAIDHGGAIGTIMRGYSGLNINGWRA